MSRYAYVNGQYLPHAAAGLHVDDRAVQFADAVYEVNVVVGGAIADKAEHLDRLERSLDAVSIAMPMSRQALSLVMDAFVRKNRLHYGLLYMQVSRGAPSFAHAVRDSSFPADTAPSLMMTCRPLDFASIIKRSLEGIAVRTMADDRWARPEVKSVLLLPNVLAKQAARDAGAYDAWMVDADGDVTEGTASNTWIVNQDGVLVTRPLSRAILAGITRETILAMAADEGIPVEERPFTVDEAQAAREAFFTSTTGGPVPVVQIDDASIGNGAPGLPC